MAIDFDSVKDQIKSSVLLEAYIPGLKKMGRVYKMCCPFHAEKTPSFTVHPEKKTWRCYGGCQTGGDIFSYAMKANGWTFMEALKELAVKANIRLDFSTSKENTGFARSLGLLKEASQFYHYTLLNTEEGIPAMDYLINVRGLSVNDIETWQIGYAPDSWTASYSHLKKLGASDEELLAAGICNRNDEGRIYDRFRHRITFPIHDDKGRVRGFSARVMPGGEDPKYINSPQSDVFSKSSLLYGLNHAKSALNATQSDFHVLTIVEGQMDAIFAHKRGFKNVVAQMGIALTDKHFETLSHHAQTIVLCLDNDAAGQGAMHKRAREIVTEGHAFRRGIDVKIASLGMFKDPDEMFQSSPALWQEAINNARSAVDVLIDYEVASLPDGASVMQKQAKSRQMMDILRVPGDAILTQDNARKLAVALGLHERSFAEWAQPQLVVMAKPAPAELTSSIEPSLERAILRDIIVNASDYWLMRANAALDLLTPKGKAMPYAFAPLSPIDFTHDTYHHMMSAILTHGAENLEDELKDTPLWANFDRVVYKPMVIAAFAADTPENQPADTYEQFLSKVYRLRLNRLKADMAIFQAMGETARFMEVATGVAILQNKQRSQAV